MIKQGFYLVMWAIIDHIPYSHAAEELMKMDHNFLFPDKVGKLEKSHKNPHKCIHNIPTLLIARQHLWLSNRTGKMHP